MWSDKGISFKDFVLRWKYQNIDTSKNTYSALNFGDDNLITTVTHVETMKRYNQKMPEVRLNTYFSYSGINFENMPFRISSLFVLNGTKYGITLNYADCKEKVVNKGKR